MNTTSAATFNCNTPSRQAPPSRGHETVHHYYAKLTRFDYPGCLVLVFVMAKDVATHRWALVCCLGRADASHGIETSVHAWED
jgi:hypothetical protein